jgi:hypothetical protein
VIKVEVAKIKIMLGQVPVEIEVTEVENGLTPDEIKNLVEAFIENGYTPPVNWSKQNADANLDKKGTVVSIQSVTGTKMFEVIAKLDDASGDFKWRVFSATTFRMQLIDDAEGTQRLIDF